MELQKIEIQVGSRIELLSNELLFLSVSGQPYRGSVYIAFESLGESFDMLDFKRYLTSLRSQTLRAEDVAHTIYTKIDTSIKSRALGVIVELSARGGIMQRVCFGELFEPHKRANIFQIG